MDLSVGDLAVFSEKDSVVFFYVREIAGNVVYPESLSVYPEGLTGRFFTKSLCRPVTELAECFQYSKLTKVGELSQGDLVMCYSYYNHERRVILFQLDFIYYEGKMINPIKGSVLKISGKSDDFLYDSTFYSYQCVPVKNKFYEDLYEKGKVV